MAKVCCFFGHSDAPHSLAPLLSDHIEHLIINHDIVEFRTGNYGAFDRMATRILCTLKAQYPSVRVFTMIPYIQTSAEKIYLVDKIDGTIYPSILESIPYRVAIPRLNQIMVDESDYAIAYVEHSWGGAAATLKYAEHRQRQGKITIVNLAQR